MSSDNKSHESVTSRDDYRFFASVIIDYYQDGQLPADVDDTVDLATSLLDSTRASTTNESHHLRNILATWVQSIKKLHEYDLRAPNKLKNYRSLPDPEKKAWLAKESIWDTVAANTVSQFEGEFVLQQDPLFAWLHRSTTARPKVQLDSQFLLKFLADEELDGRLGLVDILCHTQTTWWWSLKNGSADYAQECSVFLDQFKPQAFSIFEKAVVDSSKKLTESGDGKEKLVIQKVFDGYKNIEAKHLATSILLSDSLNYQQRQRVLVEYINTFGFVAAADLLSRISQDDSNSLQQECQELYRWIQADQVDEIHNTLSQVYENISSEHDKPGFAEYKRNTQELTNLEADKVEALGTEENTTFLDVGAGTGRLTVELAKRGKRVTAVEFLPSHIEEIHHSLATTGHEAGVIEGNWHELDKLVSGEQFDVVFCLGRTMMHNRTPEEYVSFFDQITRAVKSGGKIMVDVASSESGEAKTHLDKIVTHLRSIGVTNIDANVLFDGPDEHNKYNRRLLTLEQVKTMALLFGLELKEVEQQENQGVDNLYVTMTKLNQSKSLSGSECRDALHIIGVLNRGVDLNQYVESFGMTLGQLYLYGMGAEEDGEQIQSIVEALRRENKSNTKAGLPPRPVEVEYLENGGMNLEMTIPGRWQRRQRN